jgi:hypothetical protein
MLDYPPSKLVATCAGPAPTPRLTALRQLFDWVYLTLPAEVWSLPPQQQSAEVLRRAFSGARSFTMPCRGLDYIARDPALHLQEYLTLALMANSNADGLLAMIAQLHPNDSYPAAWFDPAGRRGRWP